MRLGGKATAVITLALGVIVGLGLVVLPGILAPTTLNSTSTNPNIRTPASAFTSSSSSHSGQSTGPTLSGNGWGGLAILAGLVIVPAISLSILVRYTTLKRARDQLTSKSQ